METALLGRSALPLLLVWTMEMLDKRDTERSVESVERAAVATTNVVCRFRLKTAPTGSACRHGAGSPHTAHTTLRHPATAGGFSAFNIPARWFIYRRLGRVRSIPRSSTVLYSSQMPSGQSQPFRIAAFSGFSGDKWTALKEQAEGSGCSVLFGDYLAEMVRVTSCQLPIS